MHSDRINKYKNLARKSWIELNSIRKNEDYIKNILKNKLTEDFQINFNRYGEYIISLSYMGKSYKIEMDDNLMEYILLEENKALNPRHKNRYHKIKSFKGNNLIEKVIIYLKDKGINKLIDKGVI